jgi:L-lactate dehydrogenase (cytochrome)
MLCDRSLTSAQLYLNKDRSVSETLIRKVERLGAAAIIFTVDVSGDSKRTMDMRTKAPFTSTLKRSHSSTLSEKSLTESLPVGRAISGYQDRNLAWKDISFIRVRNY